MRDVFVQIDQTGGERARHFFAENEQFGHARGRDDVMIGLAVDFKAGNGAQQCGPVVEVFGVVVRVGGVLRFLPNLGRFKEF